MERMGVAVRRVCYVECVCAARRRQPRRRARRRPSARWDA